MQVLVLAIQIYNTFSSIWLPLCVVVSPLGLLFSTELPTWVGNPDLQGISFV